MFFGRMNVGKMGMLTLAVVQKGTGSVASFNAARRKSVAATVPVPFCHPTL